MTDAVVFLIFELIHQLHVFNQVLVNFQNTRNEWCGDMSARDGPKKVCNEDVSCFGAQLEVKVAHLACASHGIVKVIFVESLRDPESHILKAGRIVAKRLELFSGV